MIHESAYIHPQSLVEEGASIGAGTRVWAFAHILPEAVVGFDCNICDHTFIENAVRIGDRVTIKSGAGFLATERHIGQLVQHLVWLIKNPGAWPNMTRAARRHVELEFNAGVQAKHLVEIYRELLGDKDRARKEKL